MMPHRIPPSRTRDLAWGMGWVTERSGKYLAHWRDGGRKLAKAFLLQEEAEDWLRTLYRLRDMPTEEKRRTSYDGNVVYFVRGINGGPIKIGHARNPAQRLTDLQLGSPVPLKIIAIADGGIDREMSLHREFAHLRLHGEWFKPDESLLRWITENATTLSPGWGGN